MDAIKITYNNELNRYRSRANDYSELGPLDELLDEVLGNKGLDEYFINFIFDPNRMHYGSNETDIYRELDHFAIYPFSGPELKIAKRDFYYIMAQLQEALDKRSKEIIITRDENKKYSVTYS